MTQLVKICLFFLFIIFNLIKSVILFDDWAIFSAILGSCALWKVKAVFWFDYVVYLFVYQSVKKIGKSFFLGDHLTYSFHIWVTIWNDVFMMPNKENDIVYTSPRKGWTVPIISRFMFESQITLLLFHWLVAFSLIVRSFVRKLIKFLDMLSSYNLSYVTD